MLLQAWMRSCAPPGEAPWAAWLPSLPWSAGPSSASPCRPYHAREALWDCTTVGSLLSSPPPAPMHIQLRVLAIFTQNACAGESCFKGEVSMIVTAQLLPCERPAIHAKGSGSGQVVMHASLRSASPAIIAALQADIHAFFQELFEGRLALIPVRPDPDCAQILSKMVHGCQYLGM